MATGAMTVRQTTIAVMLWALALAFCAQLVIDTSMTNLVSTIIVGVTTLVTLLYLGHTDAVDHQPLSTLVLFGFCVTTQFGALFAQSLAGTSLTASLRQPIGTFLTLAAYQLLAIAAHATYRLFSNPTRQPSLVRRSLGQLGMYATPSASALWVMGGIGCISYALPRPGFDSGAAEGVGLVGAVALAFNFLISAPFLIPLYRRIEGPQYCRSRWTWPGLALYAMVALVIAMLRNARVIMFVGAITVALGYLLVCLQNRATVRSGIFMRLALVAIGFVIIIPPVSDLATAMAIARAERSKVSGMQMLSNTLHFWQNPFLIKQFRDREGNAGIYQHYDEAYLANPLFARLVETKFHDNALYFSHTLTTRDSQESLTRTTVEFLWSILPTPILKRLGIHLDKEDLNFSMGDYLAYLSRGVPLGGRKTGSIFAQGQVVFGALFPFIYILLCFLLFKWMDLLCRRSPDGTAFPVTLALLTSWQLVHLLAPESFHQPCIAIVRGLPTAIAAYTLVFWMTRLLTGSSAKRRHEVTLNSSETVSS